MAKILIVADLGQNCAATPRGLKLAAKIGLDAEVVAFTYADLKPLKKTSSATEAVRKRLLSARKKVARANIDKYRQPRQKVELSAVWEKNIDDWIIKQCKKGKYVGVIKSGSATDSVVQASTDWQLLRQCPAPVLLVARDKWHRTKPVLVALDLGSSVRSKRALNDKILGAAKALAAALEVELKIVTVIEIPTLLADLDLVDPIAYVRDVKKEMQPQIAKLAAAHDIPESAFYCKHGPVEKVITSYAARVRAQIVVMGTVARRGVKARLLGNTAEKVLQHLKTDVLAIKP